jgi:hypothetical protein
VQDFEAEAQVEALPEPVLLAVDGEHALGAAVLGKEGA